MARIAQSFILLILILAAVVQLGFIVYISDFAFQLRTQVIPPALLVHDFNFSCQPPADLAPGTYNLIVEAQDELGNTVQKSIKVNVVAPQVACADGIDNDGDGLIDTADPGCIGETDDSEYSPGTCQQNNILQNGSFESAINITGSRPAAAGHWDFNAGVNIGEHLGIKPLAGDKMWRFDSTGASGAYATQTTSSLWQLVFTPTNAKPGSTLNFGAYFNRIAGDNKTDKQFQVEVRTYDLPFIEHFPGLWERHTSRQIVSLSSDADTRTWEPITGQITLPTDQETNFIALRVIAVEDVFNDATSPEFNGHFVDEACLSLAGSTEPTPSPSPTITPQPTSSPAPTPSPTSTPTPSPTTTPDPTPTPSPDSTPTPTPVNLAACSDGQDNDNDNFIDAADSACHADGNPNNPDSYDPNIDSEGSGPLTECSDSVDNDGDGLVDGADPQCHIDGNPTNADSYDPTLTSESAPVFLSASDEDNANTSAPDVDEPIALDYTITYQAEEGHTYNPSAGRVLSDLSRRVLGLFHHRDAASRRVSVPQANYWLSLTAKHDRPGPVDVGVYLNGWPWKSVRLNLADNQYHTHTLGQLRDFSGATVEFKFLQDRFDGYGDPDIDRNFYFDHWTLSTRQTLSGTGGAGTLPSPGQSLLPQLNSIIRSELGPEHVNADIWQFYARRLVAPPDSLESILSADRLRNVMRYWHATSPTRPRGT